MRGERKLMLAGVAAFAALGAPATAFACPVCMAARDEAERLALIGTTVFMTALPVVMIGGIIVWIVRRARELERTELDAEADPEQVRAARASAPAEIIPLHQPRP